MEIKTKFTTGERAFLLRKNVGYIYECEIHTVKATMSKDFGTLIQYCTLQPTKRNTVGFKKIKVTNTACCRYSEQQK